METWRIEISGKSLWFFLLWFFVGCFWSFFFWLFFCVFVGLNAHLLSLVDGFLGGPGRNERRASRDIKPGDKILAVNGAEVDGAMLSELQSAASMSSPKDLDLRVQREMLDVFGPQPDEKKIDSLATLSSATWTWKPPKPGGPGRPEEGHCQFPASRQSTRSADPCSESHGSRKNSLSVPQNEDRGRRSISAEPYTSPTARNSRSRDMSVSTRLNQAARSMLHCWSVQSPSIAFDSTVR